MRDIAERRVTSGIRRGDSTNGSPPVMMTSQMLGCARDVGEGRVDLALARELASAAWPHHLAAEAEAAVDRADVRRASSSTRSG